MLCLSLQAVLSAVNSRFAAVTRTGGLRAGAGVANCVLQLRRVCCDDEGRRQVRSHLPYLRHRVAQRRHRTLTLGLPLVALLALTLASIPE